MLRSTHLGGGGGGRGGIGGNIVDKGQTEDVKNLCFLFKHTRHDDDDDKDDDDNDDDVGIIVQPEE